MSMPPVPPSLKGFIESLYGAFDAAKPGTPLTIVFEPEDASSPSAPLPLLSMVRMDSQFGPDGQLAVRIVTGAPSSGDEGTAQLCAMFIAAEWHVHPNGVAARLRDMKDVMSGLQGRVAVYL